MGDIADSMVDCQMGLDSKFNFLFFRKRDIKACFKTLFINQEYYLFIEKLDLDNIDVQSLIDKMEVFRKHLIKHKIYLNYKKYDLTDISYCRNWKPSEKLKQFLINYIKQDLIGVPKLTLFGASCRLETIQNLLTRIQIMKQYEVENDN